MSTLVAAILLLICQAEQTRLAVLVRYAHLVTLTPKITLKIGPLTPSAHIRAHQKNQIAHSSRAIASAGIGTNFSPTKFLRKLMIGTESATCGWSSLPACRGAGESGFFRILSRFSTTLMGRIFSGCARNMWKICTCWIRKNSTLGSG